jgi:hypothetical protein
LVVLSVVQMTVPTRIGDLGILRII